MGYNLYITRRTSWPDDTGPEISASEWLALVDRDGELDLQPENGPHFANCRRAGEPADQWLDWSEGGLFTKNPEKWLISKMIELAAELDARVLGEEGEEYTAENLDALLDEGAAPPQPLVPYWVVAPFLAVRKLLRHRLPKCPPPPFRVGDRVRDRFSTLEATVVKIQRTAEFGYGKVRIRYDHGQEHSILFLDNTGLEPLGPQEAEEPGEPESK